MTTARSAWLVAMLVLALLAGGCAGGSDEGETFPEFRVVYDTGLDYLDPALSYTVQGSAIMWHVYLPVLTYRHVSGPEGAELVGGVAESVPEPSADGRTYTVTVREGLKYSDGSTVKASDVKASIERLFRVSSPGVGFFSNIEGAEEFARTQQGSISGIVADDAARTVTFRLSEPRGDFLNVLATQFAAVLPASTPASDQSTTPPPANGPYVIESYEPNRQVRLARNPHFEETDEFDRGNPDRITIDIVADDSEALQRVIDGDGDYNFHAVPLDRLREVREQYGDRLKVYTPANTYYYFMNTRVPPFDKLEVRKAVNHAIDRRALVRLYGGLATPTENVLPPTYPQYRKISMYPHDPAKARRLVEQAGAVGAPVTIWTSSRDVQRRPGEYLVGVLEGIGLKVDLKVVDPAIYFTRIGEQRTKAQIGLANWFQDYPHPLNWFDVLLNGNRISEQRNNNYSNADVEEINREIEALKREPELTDEVDARWAALDRKVAEQALWAPFINRQFTDFFSAEMDVENCYVNHVLYQLDFSRVCKK